MYDQLDPFVLDRPQYALRIIAIVMVSISYVANASAPAVRFGMPVLFAVALLLVDFVQPRTYGVTAVVLAAVGTLIARDPRDALTLYYTIVVMAALRLPFAPAAGLALLVYVCYVAGSTAAGTLASALPSVLYFAATFTIAAGIAVRRAARQRQLEMITALERSHAQLRAAHEQLQLDSQLAADLAASEERSRIAREVHDILAHTLTVLVVQIGATKRLIDQDRDKAKQQLDTVAQLARDGLAEVRRSVHALHSPHENGVPALAVLVQEFAQRTNTACHFEVASDLPILPPDVSTALYRVTQEALTNAVRHGNAHEIVARLHRDAIDLVLTIGDDGIGAGTAGPAAGGGNGLRGARERLAAFGGTLLTRTGATGGFTVEARVPITSLAIPAR